MVGFWVNNTLVVVRNTHNATAARSCWLGHDLFSRSSITVICLMLISSMMFTYGILVFWRLWLTYVVCQMMCIWQESGVSELRFNCHNECTIRILTQVLSRRCWQYFRLFLYLSYTSLVVVCVFLLALCPYVSMGIVALWVNYWHLNNVQSLSVLTGIIGRHIHQCQSWVCTHKRRDPIWIVSLFVLEWGSSGEVFTLLTLDGVPDKFSNMQCSLIFCQWLFS